MEDFSQQGRTNALSRKVPNTARFIALDMGVDPNNPVVNLMPLGREFLA